MTVFHPKAQLPENAWCAPSLDFLTSHRLIHSQSILTLKNLQKLLIKVSRGILIIKFTGNLSVLLLTPFISTVIVQSSLNSIFCAYLLNYIHFFPLLLLNFFLFI